MMTQHTEQAQNTSSTASRRETIVLIDGHAMIHRAFHAVPENLTTKSGEPGQRACTGHGSKTRHQRSNKL